jgi:outer membrane biogenesis lipoprotein LolB
MKKPVITGLIVLLVFYGCTAIGTGIKKFELNSLDQAAIKKHLRKNYSEINSVSGRFDFAYSTASEKKQSSGYIYISKKDTTYIEIKGLVGETEAVFFMDKDSLKAVNYFEKVLIKGRSDENSICRITGMNISVSDLRNSLLCYNSTGDSLKIIKKEPDKIVLRLKLSEKEYQFVTLNENLLITEIDEYFEREIRFKKEYDYYSSKSGHVMPKRIRIRTFNPPTKLTVFYTGMRVNEDPEVFSGVSL